MRKRLLCSAQISFDIEVKGPLLIKSGQESIHGPDMSPVVTYASGEEAKPYIPGTSLKGVLRSHCERILRTLLPEKTPVCLPYLFESNHPERSCGKRLEKSELPTPELYRCSCMACKIFGSLAFRGRTFFTDGYAKGEVKTEVRDGVAIDRKTGGAATGAKYDLMVVVKGLFQTSIAIENFESWQLGLLALGLRDMEEERLPLGLGTSRGLGHVKAHIHHISLRYPFDYTGQKILGIEARATKQEKAQYGFGKAPEALDDILPPPQEDGVWNVYALDTEEKRKQLLSWSRRALQTYLPQDQWNQGLQPRVWRDGMPESSGGGR